MAAVNAIALSTASKVLSASSSSSIRGELESVRNCFFWLLIACTAVVAIGVLLEVAEDWFPLGKPVLDRNTGIFRPSPSIRWRKTVINLGWKLVVIGVIGEGIFELATSGADETLQAFNNTLLAITIDEAGSAAKSAKAAHDEANAASKASDKALDKSNAANDAAGKAQEKVAAVSGRADDIDERLKLAVSMLSVRSVRHLLGMTDIMKQSKWPRNVVFKSYSGDWEAFNVCIELALAMSSPNTGTTVKSGCGGEPLTLLPMPVTGIAICWPDVFLVFKLRRIFLNDGGIGKVADIGGGWPCREGGPTDTSEMEIFVGVNPGFSLSRFENEEKALKQHKTKQSNPKP